MDIVLSNTEARVLGALVEKESTTPEYYPLSLNALVNACNQRSNRDPVMNLDDEEVRQALDSLNERGLADARSGAESRVTKYEHRLAETFNFGRRETAVLCVLLLRGPQTPGELRGRTERMHHFSDLDEVQSALHRLMGRETPLVRMLPRQPGTKEPRYAHLLSGEPEGWEASAEPSAAAGTPEADGRVAKLEAAVEALQAQIADLQQQFSDFRKQFE